MMLMGKVQSLYTVLRSENRAPGRSSGSHTIFMESISNSLVGQMNSGSTAEVNFPGLEQYSFDSDETTRRENGLVLGLSLGSDIGPHSWYTLLSPGNVSIVS